MKQRLTLILPAILIILALATAVDRFTQTQTAGAQTAVVNDAGRKIIWGWCSGTATSSASALGLFNLGSNSTACTGTIGTSAFFLVTGSGTISNLSVRCAHTGVQQASFTGAISGTTLTVSGVTGAVAIGQAVTGTGVALNTVITAGSGSTWTVSIAQTVASEAMTSSASGAFLLIYMPSGTAQANAINSAVTLTYGTTPADTVVQDTVHSFAVTPGTLVAIKYTTQASEVLANCAGSFTYTGN